MTAIPALCALLLVGAPCVVSPSAGEAVPAPAAEDGASVGGSIPAVALAAPLTGESGEPKKVTALRIDPASDRTEVVISVSGEVDFRDFTMEDPHRLIVDIYGARLGLPRESYEGIDRGGVESVRTSQYSEDVVRVVLDLREPVGYSVIPGPGTLTVTFANPAGPFEGWSSPAGPTPTGTPAAGASGDRAGGAEADPSGARRSAGEKDLRTSPAATKTLGAQQVSVADARRITVSFVETPMLDVLNTFAEYANRSIVPGSAVQGAVNAEIRHQPWDVALQAILEAHGLSAREMESGILRVDALENLREREQVEDLYTRPFRINYATATQLEQAVTPLLSERGKISIAESTNTLVVTDVQRVLDQVGQMIEQLDIRTPQISISAKIIFINRTDLAELGVRYDLKDSKGNQLNVLTPGGRDEDGDGVITEEEQVDTGEDVISLGGSSIAALGNATQSVAGPTLSVLTTLVLGRYSLVSFIDALQSLNLSDIQAAPSITVMDNRPANILVGERTPIRVVDAAGGQSQGGVIPRASVEIQETGVKLEVTPHVTSSGDILLELLAERSSAEVAEADVGFIFRTQEAQSEVLLRDGETAVIAGLTVTERSVVRSGIPFLMDLPFLGRFFRLSRDQEVRRDLMILVTPHIVRSPAADR